MYGPKSSLRLKWLLLKKPQPVLLFVAPQANLDDDKIKEKMLGYLAELKTKKKN